MSINEIDLNSLPVHRYETQIRERHLDTFGHVNNAQYLILFEEARWEMITERGRGMDEVLRTQIGTVVLDCAIRFKRELKLREKITITTRMQSMNKKVFVIQHQLLKENGESAAEATFTVGCFDLKQRKIVTPTPEWLNAVAGLSAS